MAQRDHTGEESGQGNMGSFCKYGATEFLREDNTSRTDLDHHDNPPKR